jgi:hypothetical protein
MEPMEEAAHRRSPRIGMASCRALQSGPCCCPLIGITATGCCSRVLIVAPALASSQPGIKAVTRTIGKCGDSRAASGRAPGPARRRRCHSGDSVGARRLGDGGDEEEAAPCSIWLDGGEGSRWSRSHNDAASDPDCNGEILTRTGQRGVEL